MPVTAIIGYPPGTMGPEETGAQAAELYAAGWRRFKAPIGGAAERSAARLRAARAAAPDAWLGMDAAWVYEDVETAASFIESIPDVGLGWFEDVFPPGDAGILRRLRDRIDVPIAMGDEQGGSYFPEALITAGAVDVVRVDLTCMGGLTQGRRVIDQALAAGLDFAPHMFPHVHSQVLAALGYADRPIEWGIPNTGVHPMDDPLPQPVILEGGLMTPLPELPGFGHLVDVDWVRSQPHDDPSGMLADLG
jgi:L-alanine-DL-glutamate epimerase-like enolase superfamily enzyme